MEDSVTDAELLVRALERASFDVSYLRVDTAAEMRQALVDEPWDVVLSDYTMPTFSALDALEVLNRSGLRVPFIIVSGTIGEDAAVAALKAGAEDFLLKGRLTRLQSCVERALRDADVRREHEAAQAAQQSSELKYRRIVETSQEGIWVVDAQGITTYVNARMAEMLGEAPQDLLGVPFVDFADDEWKRHAIETVLRREMEPRLPQEFKFRRHDGSALWALLSTSPIEGSEQGPAEALVMVTDITEQRRLQTQLMVSDRMASVGVLAAGVAHEINNPLAAALANLALVIDDVTELAAEARDPARLLEVLEQLNDAREASERVRNVVQDLRIFSRVEDETRELVDVERVLESSVRMARNEIRHRARLVTAYQKLPPVEATESRLGQVFLNLLVNAAHAIVEGRTAANEIRIATSVATDGRVAIEIRDTGCGMSADVQGRLFTPFFSTKPIGVGTGLGLSICQRIVTSFGGEITVESEVGKGSTFRVLLPPASPRGGNEEPRSAVTDGINRRAAVLVVDDEEIVIAAIRRALERDHDVSSTMNAREAVDLIASGKHFDAILCDLMMPQMTGMDFHAELTRIAPEQAKRIVFLTGGAFTVAARDFLEKVDNECLDKPFGIAALRAVVAAASK